MFPEWETYDEDESDRWDSIALRKARGKGNPKKKRTPEGEFSFLVCMGFGTGRKSGAEGRK